LSQIDIRIHAFSFDLADLEMGDGAFEPAGMSAIEAPCRLAVVSTPRAGNTWLRHLLRSLFRFEHPDGELAVHLPGDVPWAALPERCVLQLHWHRVEPFVSLLREHRFRVVTLARHPIDVLISILRFAPYQPATARWLAGEGGDERAILGVSPRSSAFLDYATGPRARALLSVTREWWDAADCHRLRYEDLVGNTAAALRQLADAVGGVSPGRITEAIEANSMQRLRDNGHGPHIWKGHPGLWTFLLTAPEAERIAAAHAEVFRDLGYTCQPDHALSADLADENWRAFKES
jgi:hypothetical protein